VPFSSSTPVALLFTPGGFLKRLNRVCLAIQKFRPQGLATLSTGLAHPRPKEPLSALATLGLRPSELSSSSVIEKKVSLLFLRSGLFPPNLPGLMSRLQRFGPTEEAVPPPASPTV
jgi:hypothetical protein